MLTSLSMKATHCRLLPTYFMREMLILIIQNYYENVYSTLGIKLVGRDFLDIVLAELARLKVVQHFTKHCPVLSLPSSHAVRSSEMECLFPSSTVFPSSVEVLGT